jgi:hypothetical protein
MLLHVTYRSPVIIVNDVWSRQTFRDISYQNPRSVTSLLAGTSWTSFSDGSLDTFAKLLVLDFFLASIYLQPVDYYEDLIYPQVSEKGILEFSLTKNPHLQVPLGLFEPRLSTKSKEAFKEIEGAEGVLRSIDNLVDSIRFVIEELKADDFTGAPFFRKKMLERLCTERQDNAQRALHALGRQLDYLTKRHSIREAKSIKVLTILASLYLPLSLSASLLGMQNPLRAVAHSRTSSEQDDIGGQNLVGTNLLFDFFGVFIVLATSTVFIVYGIRGGLWIKSHGLGMLSNKFRDQYSILHYGRRWRFGGPGGKWFGWLRYITAWWICGGISITLLVIFLIGMLRDGQRAWHSAKWMFTGYCVVSILLVMSSIFFYLRLSHKRRRS